MPDPGAPTLALLTLCGAAAGAVNSIAGGGSLITFPALLAAGYPSLDANVTNAVAVLPGYAGGSVGYRAELRGQGRRALSLGLASAAGAALGAAALLVAPPGVFGRIVPWLILGACALLAAQPLIRARLARRAAGRAERVPLWGHAVQLLGSAYGGYFGAAVGVVMLAALGLLLDDTLQRLNALKGLLSLVIGGAAVLVFALLAPVAWRPAALMGLGALAGGRLGVGAARRLDERVLRWTVIALGVAVAVRLLL